MTESDNSFNNPNDNSSQGNPAWDEFLSAIPEDYHEKVQPVLQKWDQGVQQRFEQYKPYERYVKEGIDPQVVDYGLNLMNKLDNQDGALEIFQTLGNYLEQQGLLGQEEDEEEDNGDFDYNSLPPQLRKQIESLEQGYGTLAEYQLMQEQQRREAQEDQLLEQELGSLREKYGDFDEEWVLAKMVNGADTEDAVKSYHQWVDNQLQNRNRPKAPRLVGSSGDFPSTQNSFDPKKANDRQTRDYVAQFLQDYQNNR
jgi:hypothetical protein